MTDIADYRLPRSVLPRHYQLELTPDLAASRFDGEEVVTLDVVEPVDTLVCNAAELESTTARLETPAGRRPGRPGRARRGRPAGHASRFDEQLVRRLRLPAAPALHRHPQRPAARLLPQHLHATTTGTEHVIAVTQFEPADARRAFPCWDEPEFKAVFAVTLVVDDDLTALSNAPVAERGAGGDGRRRVRFNETMVMSTYLVAFVVGPVRATPRRGG